MDKVTRGDVLMSGANHLQENMSITTSASGYNKFFIFLLH